MRPGKADRLWNCPRCDSRLIADSTSVDPAGSLAPRRICPACGRAFRLRRMKSYPDETLADRSDPTATSRSQADFDPSRSETLTALGSDECVRRVENADEHLDSLDNDEPNENQDVMETERENDSLVLDPSSNETNALDRNALEPDGLSDSAIVARSTQVLGPWGVATRDLGLRFLENVYKLGVVAGTAGLLVAGGFIPVVQGWLDDEIEGWKGIVERLGGAWPQISSRDGDSDIGPILLHGDAPRLFSVVDEISRRAGCRAPEEIRIAYLPCCAVTVWKRRRALVVGLPLLIALSIAELRAVLAHELAHLARKDAARADRAERFTLGLALTLDHPPIRSWRSSPLRGWASACRRIAESLRSPIALGRESRADRFAAKIAGGAVAASSLISVALVQPIFRELLDGYDPLADNSHNNVFDLFHDLWLRIPDGLRDSILAGILADPAATDDGSHPPLASRLESFRNAPEVHTTKLDRRPAWSLLADLDAIEEILHNRLFRSDEIEPSVFHEAGR